MIRVVFRRRENPSAPWAYACVRVVTDALRGRRVGDLEVIWILDPKGATTVTTALRGEYRAFAARLERELGGTVEAVEVES